jgi:hypothetical protein
MSIFFPVKILLSALYAPFRVLKAIGEAVQAEELNNTTQGEPHK